MAKCLVFFITSLVVPVFITGCTLNGTEPNIVKPDGIASVPSESDQIEPDRIQSAGSEPSNIQSDIIEQNEPETLTIVIEEVTPVEPDPVEVESVSFEPDEQEIEAAVSFGGKCAPVLKDFVDDKGMVDYTTLRRQRLKLKALLRQFQNLDPDEYRTWTRENKIAFWLNAYNIQMLKIITDNYPIRSSRILRLYPGWGPNSILHIKGMWTDYKFLVMDEEFTLSEIDKRFFRKEFDDPRIFFALSRGSLSSPPLRNEPYYGHRLDKQLDDQVNRFLTSPLALNIDTKKQRVYLSSLFQSSSYGREFIGKYAIDKKFKDHEPTTRAVLNFITNYVSRDKVSFLEVGNYSVKYMKYDWTINDGS
jgi:hypothetical protein